MKPFILQYRETPLENDMDFSMIEYDCQLNLNVHRKTRIPAVRSISCSTTTFTKTQGEGHDSDANSSFLAMMETHTGTFTHHEEMSDSDKDRMAALLDTVTATRVINEDDDKDFN